VTITFGLEVRSLLIFRARLSRIYCLFDLAFEVFYC
jgi:hypothetical protein